MNLSKYFKGVYVELKRSEIHFADYNPRDISDDEHKALKRGVKQYGLLGGLIVNNISLDLSIHILKKQNAKLQKKIRNKRNPKTVMPMERG